VCIKCEMNERLLLKKNLAYKKIGPILCKHEFSKLMFTRQQEPYVSTMYKTEKQFATLDRSLLNSKVCTETRNNRRQFIFLKKNFLVAC
jgi:hypothetical protein